MCTLNLAYNDTVYNYCRKGSPDILGSVVLASGVGESVGIEGGESVGSVCGCERSVDGVGGSVVEVRPAIYDIGREKRGKEGKREDEGERRGRGGGR